MINMVFLGPPGAGKGTQSERIVNQYKIVQISTGDILRAAVREGTKLGKLAKQYMDEGKLVTDDIIIGIVRDRLAEPDCTDGFILDGFPRTIPQAEALEKMLSEDLDKEITHIVSLEVPDEFILERLTGRRSCKSCGRAYHVKYNPPKSDNCECGGEIIHRDDDREETINNRLEVYHNQTSTLKSFYEKSGNLYVLDGVGDPDAIFERVQDILTK